MLAPRLCWKVFAFVKRKISGAQRRKDAASGERGAGKGAAALVPASAHRNSGARLALRILSFRLVPSTECANVLCSSGEGGFGSCRKQILDACREVGP